MTTRSNVRSYARPELLAQRERLIIDALRSLNGCATTRDVARVVLRSDLPETFWTKSPDYAVYSTLWKMRLGGVVDVERLPLGLRWTLKYP